MAETAELEAPLSLQWGPARTQDLLLAHIDHRDVTDSERTVMIGGQLNRSTRTMLDPVQVHASPAEPPHGHWLQRAAVALFVEHRLPYQLSVPWNRFCNAAGFRFKTVSAGDYRVRVRRLTHDEDFIENTLIRHDYNPPGYEIGESDVVIDIGGNIGAYALYAARHARKGHVYSFEPCRENYDMFRQNLALNRVTNVTVVHAALTGTARQVKLHVSEDTGSHSIALDRIWNPSRFEVVDGIPLQDVFDTYRIERCHLMKIDCEGAEYEILYSLPREYFQRIDRITMEYHGAVDPDERRQQSNELVGFFQNLGYRIDDYRECVGFRCGFIRAARTS
jgi:FkbM family methyltransferase